MSEILSTAELKKLGYSKQEINTYHFLAKNGESAVPDLSTIEGKEEFAKLLVEPKPDGSVDVYEQDSLF